LRKPAELYLYESFEYQNIMNSTKAKINDALKKNEAICNDLTVLNREEEKGEENIFDDLDLTYSSNDEVGDGQEFTLNKGSVDLWYSADNDTLRSAMRKILHISENATLPIAEGPLLCWYGSAEKTTEEVFKYYKNEDATIKYTKQKQPKKKYQDYLIDKSLKDCLVVVKSNDIPHEHAVIIMPVLSDWDNKDGDRFQLYEKYCRRVVIFLKNAMDVRKSCKETISKRFQNVPIYLIVDDIYKAAEVGRDEDHTHPIESTIIQLSALYEVNQFMPQIHIFEK